MLSGNLEAKENKQTNNESGECKMALNYPYYYVTTYSTWTRNKDGWTNKDVQIMEESPRREIRSEVPTKCNK